MENPIPAPLPHKSAIKLSFLAAPASLAISYFIVGLVYGISVTNRLDSIVTFPPTLGYILFSALYSLPGLAVVILIDKMNSGWKDVKYYLVLAASTIILSIILEYVLYQVYLITSFGSFM